MRAVLDISRNQPPEIVFRGQFSHNQGRRLLPEAPLPGKARGSGATVVAGPRGCRCLDTGASRGRLAAPLSASGLDGRAEAGRTSSCSPVPRREMPGAGSAARARPRVARRETAAVASGCRAPPVGTPATSGDFAYLPSRRGGAGFHACSTR